MALLSKTPYPTSQYAAAYRMAPPREHFFASPTESEFADHVDSSGSVRSWDEERVAEWLRSINCSQYIELFNANNINGSNLMELDRNSLREMGVRKVGDQIRIATQAKAFRTQVYKRASMAVRNMVRRQPCWLQLTDPRSHSTCSTIRSSRLPPLRRRCTTRLAWPTATSPNACPAR
jgi:mitogen-activated protein kinase kinase kinase